MNSKKLIENKIKEIIVRASMDKFNVMFDEARHNIKYYGEFYLSLMGYFAIQVITYLFGIIAASKSMHDVRLMKFIGIYADITVRVLFSLAHYFLIYSISYNMDFYQFRWLVLMSLCQLMHLLSVEVNPLHCVVIMAIVSNPLLNILKIQDLKRIDPFSVLLHKSSKDDLLP
jgi:hypothetical protein